MKKFVKKILKCLIIYVVVGMTILSNISYGFTPEEIGSAVAGYALNLLEWGNKEENYCDGLGGYGPALRYNQRGSQGKNRMSHPTFNNPNPDLPWFYDCSSFTAAMYNMVCNKEICGWSDTTSSFSGNSNLECIGNASTDGAKMIPGDIVCTSGKHVEIFISQELGTGGAHSTHLGSGTVNLYSSLPKQVDCPGTYGKRQISPSNGQIYRITQEAASTVTDLNTEFALTNVSNSNAGGKKIDYSEFYFNGIPDGKYSLASKKGIFEMIVDLLKDFLNYFVGLLTYILRGVIVSFISVFDRLLNNTIGSMEGTPKSLKEAGITATSADDPSKMNRSVTIEGLIFNDVDIFDINIFQVENDGGNEE